MASRKKFIFDNFFEEKHQRHRGTMIFVFRNNSIQQKLQLLQQFGGYKRPIISIITTPIINLKIRFN